MMKLPYGEALKFDGLTIGTNVYYNEGKLSLALRRSVPHKWMHLLRLGPPPKVDLFSSQAKVDVQEHVFQNRKDFIEMSFSWPGQEPKCFAERKGNKFVQVLDDGKSYSSQGSAIQEGQDGGIFNVVFANETPLKDILHLRLIAGYESKTNDWVVLGKMRVKNPVPKDRRQ